MYLDGEPRAFHIPSALGNIGFISTVTAPFYASCNRARLTADGILRMCLPCEHEISPLMSLRSGATLDDLRNLVLNVIWNNPRGHSLAEGEILLKQVISEIEG